MLDIGYCDLFTELALDADQEDILTFTEEDLQRLTTFSVEEFEIDEDLADPEDYNWGAYDWEEDES